MLAYSRPGPRPKSIRNPSLFSRSLSPFPTLSLSPAFSLSPISPYCMQYIRPQELCTMSLQLCVPRGWELHTQGIFSCPRGGFRSVLSASCAHRLTVPIAWPWPWGSTLWLTQHGLHTHPHSQEATVCVISSPSPLNPQMWSPKEEGCCLRWARGSTHYHDKWGNHGVSTLDSFTRLRLVGKVANA